MRHLPALWLQRLEPVRKLRDDHDPNAQPAPARHAQRGADGRQPLEGGKPANLSSIQLMACSALSRASKRCPAPDSQSIVTARPALHCRSAKSRVTCGLTRSSAAPWWQRATTRLDASRQSETVGIVEASDILRLRRDGGQERQQGADQASHVRPLSMAGNTSVSGWRWRGRPKSGAFTVSITAIAPLAARRVQPGAHIESDRPHANGRPAARDLREKLPQAILGDAIAIVTGRPRTPCCAAPANELFPASAGQSAVVGSIAAMASRTTSSIRPAAACDLDDPAHIRCLDRHRQGRGCGWQGKNGGDGEASKSGDHLRTSPGLEG